MAVLSRDRAASAGAAERDWTAVFSSRWMLPIILLLTFAAYAPTLNDWFTTDDFWFLHSSQSEPWGGYTLRAFDYRETGTLPELNRYRPLYPLTWKLQYELFGLNATAYHATSIAAHLGAVALSWFVFRRLLGAGWAANLATLIFALHPIHGSTVAWLSNNRVFAGLPYIASLLLFMKYCDGPGRWRWAAYGGSLLLFVAAILMHSAAATLAIGLALYVFAVQKAPRDALRVRNWLPLAPFLVITAGYAAVQWQVRDDVALDAAFRFGWHQFAVYAQAMGMLVLPMETFDESLVERVLERLQLLAAAAFVLLGFAMMYRRPFWGLAVFAWLWLLAGLAPDSTFIVGAMSRMLYMPAVAGALVLVLMLFFVRDLLPREQRQLAVSIAPYVLLAAVVPMVWMAYTRTDSVRGSANVYERFAEDLRGNGPEVPQGGTLFVAGLPVPGIFIEDSHGASLIGLYYPDNDVVIVHARDPAPVLGPDDRLYTYAP